MANEQGLDERDRIVALEIEGSRPTMEDLLFSTDLPVPAERTFKSTRNTSEVAFKVVMS
jgi:hypothetical protein